VQPSDSEESSPQIVVTLNWFSELERLVDEGQ